MERGRREEEHSFGEHSVSHDYTNRRKELNDPIAGKGFRPNKGRNVMEDSPSPYQLDSSSSNESNGPNAPLDGRGVGAYDIEWEPKDRIVSEEEEEKMDHLLFRCTMLPLTMLISLIIFV